ncbi:serine hydrolase domain-containing protein [Nannocystis sp. SCPEA4]|uniref:serine hydrolase domain-containing protein n=1 Tax=Nannocystis sp. SCPEA4 TaxID=2996787 RepID=UPI00226DA05E|nr:serine hydrolase domain-containing protein [Nannocystis sp. SCPEA4]MCY1054054.1 serine hydrolase [Nannocystis sp. SCPEA4]
MHRGIALLSFLAALELGCAHQVRPSRPTSAPLESVRMGPTMKVRDVPPAVFKDPKRQEKIAAALPKIHDVVAEVVAADRLVGLAIGVVVDGKLVLGEGFGKLDSETGGVIDTHTAFRIGSITKVFTGMTALRLWEQGKLDLDAPAAGVLPELNNLVYPSGDARPLTVRDILTHSAGLPRDPDLPVPAPAGGYTRDDVMHAIDGMSLVRAPGVGSEYSNLGFVLLGHIIAATTGQPFGVAIREAILQPLGMNETVWEAGDVAPAQLTSGHVVTDGTVKALKPRAHNALSAAGGLFSTVHDLARFVAFQLDAWPPRADADDAPLARSTLREAQRLRAHRSFRARTTADEAADGGVEGGESGVGLPWSVSHGCEQAYVVGHNGAVDGFHATVRMLPNAGIGIIVLGNASWADTDQIAVDIQRVLDGAGALGGRGPQPLPELTEAASRVVDLFSQWDEPTFAKWAAHGWSNPASAAALGAKMRWLHERLGECTLDKLKRPTSAWSGVFGLKCKLGDAELTLGLTSAEVPKIDTIELEWLKGEPATELHAAAVAAAPLLTAFDPANYEALFSPGFGRTRLERALADVKFEHGVCTLDKPLEVRGPREAVYALKCEKGTAKLGVTLDRGTPARIVGFNVASTGVLPTCR